MISKKNTKKVSSEAKTELLHPIETNGKTQIINSNIKPSISEQNRENYRSVDESNKTEIIFQDTMLGQEETATKTSIIYPNNEKDKTLIVNHEDYIERKDYHPILHLCDKENGGRIFETPINDDIVLGRKREFCDLLIDYDRTVSSRQCRFYVKGDKLYISDMGGTNQTYLNNRPLSEDRDLVNGDVIGAGRINLHVSIIETD